MASSARVFGNSCRTLMAAAKSSAASTAAAEKPKAAGRVTGILKVQPVSPALAKFLGSPEASRSGAVKKIWEYVKSHNLQNPSNKREIYCDDKLKAIFDGNDKVNFQGVAKLLSNHFPKTT
ncbi:Upstream activation factor subunit spp27 [Sesamum alatum]|uniref:Upstream activation factor subunit spp27 n=1 Tax=Sesamum alatum TaxID=300844 RepID=A0AAE1Y2J4_9LAMI|nr:Upstream activation factor subunit spp27 [Sesamum alatum]